jgi:hypothetical protein
MSAESVASTPVLRRDALAFAAGLPDDEHPSTGIREPVATAIAAASDTGGCRQPESGGVDSARLGGE